MSELEQPSKPFPMADDVIIKLPKGTDIVVVGTQIFAVRGSSLYDSTQEFGGKLAKPIYDNSSPHLFMQGIKVEILEPGKQWKSGKFRCRLVFEFIPDEPENNNTASQSMSSLDDLRKIDL